jgi:preprotein translocase subunit SecA
MITKLLQKIFGTANDKELKRYTKIVLEINALEEKYKAMSDEEIQAEFESLKNSVKNSEKSLEDVKVESFAITREAGNRVLNMRHYDVQLVGGLVLNDGRIAEMKTGEGKTLVATLAVSLNAMSGDGVHVVTVNDYLASRDAKEMEPLYNFLGYSVGVVTGDMYEDSERKEAYMCDITYGTNNEFGFDYLRDNMKYSLDEVAQLKHNFAIVDEVDSILIDEARTPLIISGPTNHKMEHYIKSNEVAKELELEKDFTVDEKNKVVLITEEGIKKSEELFGVENLYDMENAKLAHQLDQALKANYLFEIDKDYVVKNDEVIIVDEFTGRLSEGRRFSEGLHQALEAKEGVEIKEESQTLADITFQNYFRLYNKLAGMTGTAQTEATEFAQIYKLEVISIPTNVPVQRKDLNDLIYKTEREKFIAVVNKINELNKKGQPVLVGTASIERSEALHKILKAEKIPHTVLNAKQHEKEANIILDAGKKGAVTIATNMAGRGVDIKIDDEVRSLGGLAIIGTERHESRRIDNQLRGRSGRQGDPGESQFYLSLEDTLLRIFGSDKIKNIMDKLGIEEGEHIESSMVTRAVENAQKKVEGMHFESRKHLLEYDDVSNEQRKVIYNFRRDLLDPEYDTGKKVEENRAEYVADLVARCDIFDGLPKEDYNIEKLTALIKEDVNEEMENLSNLEYEELMEAIIKVLQEKYEQKMEMVVPEQRREIEKVIYLQVVDNAWREHLYQMDILKTGIHLRGYNQKDPLVEYKKESYNLFIELTNRIKFESFKTLHMIQLRSQDEQKEIEEMMAKMEAEAMSDIELKHEDFGVEQKEEKVEKKIPRNDPCPCGSGKKYKQCCGKSGPKKGLVAN